MDNKILVLSPYKKSLLVSLNEVRLSNFGIFILIGNKNIIIENCFQCGIDYHDFVIIDINNDMEIVDKANDMLKKQDISFVIFGDHKKCYFNIFKNTNDNEISNVEIINLPDVKQLIFLCNINHNIQCDFNDKKNSILLGYEIMNILGYKKINVSFVGNKNSSIDILEKNIVKMMIKDQEIRDITIHDPYSIKELFSKNNKINIYNHNLNLLITRNYDTTKLFIETLELFTSCRIGQFITANGLYAIDASNLSNSHNLLFTMFILKKIYENKNINCCHENYMVK